MEVVPKMKLPWSKPKKLNPDIAYICKEFTVIWVQRHISHKSWIKFDDITEFITYTKLCERGLLFGIKSHCYVFFFWTRGDWDYCFEIKREVDV